MAENKNKALAEPLPDPMQELVTVCLDRATGKEETTAFVALNGKGYTIERGKPVRVPRPVADILFEADRQRDRQEAYQQSLKDRAMRSGQF